MKDSQIRLLFRAGSIFYFLSAILICPLLYADVLQSDSKQDKERGIKFLESEVIASRQVETRSAPRKKSLKSADPAWEFIRKQKIDASQPLSLAELIDTALRNNPQTRQAWENVMVARSLKGQAQSSLYPQVTIAETVTRQKQVSQQSLFSTDNLEYGPTANLTYLLLDFGGRGSRIKGAVEGLLSADAQYNQAIQDLILNTETAYYRFYSAQSALEAARADVENAKTDFYAAQQRFDAGLATKLDVLEAKSNYDDTLYSLESAKGDVKTAQATLAQAIGFAADTKFKIMYPAKDLPTNINEKDVTLLIEEAIEKRQDIASLRADLKTKNALVRAATSDLLPTLNLGASGQKSKYKQYDSTSGITQVDHTYSAFASVNWNIFDGFYNLNKRRQAKAESDMAFDALIQAEVALSADVWTKYYNFYTAVQKLKFSETFFKTASASYELARESYVSGLKSILDLLQSQSKLKDARSRLIQSKEDVFIALAELAHATGSLNADNKEASRTKMELGRNKREK